MTLCRKEFQFVHIKVNSQNNGSWMLTAVYASPSEVGRKNLWEALQNIADNMNEPWLIVGDFNEVASITEKKGGS